MSLCADLELLDSPAFQCVGRHTLKSVYGSYDPAGGGGWRFSPGETWNDGVITRTYPDVDVALVVAINDAPRFCALLAHGASSFAVAVAGACTLLSNDTRRRLFQCRL